MFCSCRSFLMRRFSRVWIHFWSFHQGEDRPIRRMPIFFVSKIKLVGYHRWRVLIGWATSRLSSDTSKSVNKQNGSCWIAFCRRPQLYWVKANWLPVSRHWDFPQISEEQKSWRAGRRKIVQTRDRAINHRKSLTVAALLFGSVGTEQNCQNSSFLDSPLKIYSLALVFVKFVWRKAVTIAVAFRCCTLYIERAVKNKTTTGSYGLVWESLNCWMFN